MGRERCPTCGVVMTPHGLCPACGLVVPVGQGQPTEATPDEAQGSTSYAPVTTGFASGLADVLRGIGKVRATMAALVFVAGVFWVVTAGRQFHLALDNRPGGAGFLVFASAPVSLILGAYAGRVTWMVLRQSDFVQGQLVLTCVLGIAWCFLMPLPLEGWYMLLLIPLHLVVGIFALFGSRHLEPGRPV